LRLEAEQGKLVVELARQRMEAFVRQGDRSLIPRAESWLNERRGAFVTLNVLAEQQLSLRGCVGFPYPVKSLGEAVQEAAIVAASEDPRFPPVQKDELQSIVVEVSVLTNPELIEVPRRLEMPSMVKVGEDGLIVSNSVSSGLLLPQVAVENGMGPEDFLSHACMKAGLTPDSWLDPATKVQRFQAEVFAERSPRGEVFRVPL